MTEAHVRERLVQGSYPTARRSGSRTSDQCINYYVYATKTQDQGLDVRAAHSTLNYSCYFCHAFTAHSKDILVNLA